MLSSVISEGTRGLQYTSVVDQNILNSLQAGQEPGLSGQISAHVVDDGGMTESAPHCGGRGGGGGGGEVGDLLADRQ